MVKKDESKSGKPKILCIDDDLDVLNLISLYLNSHGFEPILIDEGWKACEVAEQEKPDLILIDVNIPKMSGFEVCSRIHQIPELIFIPIIFISVDDDKKTRTEAFSLGAVDYILKPIKEELLIQKIKSNLEKSIIWKEFLRELPSSRINIIESKFIKFKEYLYKQLESKENILDLLYRLEPINLYSISSLVQLSDKKLAEFVSDFLNLEYVSFVNSADIELGVLPTIFCIKNSVVPIHTKSSKLGFIMSNPFDLELLDDLGKLVLDFENSELFITEPSNIDNLFHEGITTSIEKKSSVKIIETDQRSGFVFKELLQRVEKSNIKEYPILLFTNKLLESAVDERASDIHIEAKNTSTIIRFRIDGDLRDFYTLKKEVGEKVISRYKVLSELDITEKRKPQDGSFEALIENRLFKLRLATTISQYGEGLVIRLLEPGAKLRDLNELGLNEKQIELLLKLTSRTQGLISIVGPTGSGKTTTAYSLLSKIDFKHRSLISVEDPIEYSIPFANQQQVNDKIKVTFEVLLKSAVRQDPDILFLGEIRDTYSARMAIDFASTGHLTFSTMHTANATSALFRLERLGIDRGSMADAINAVIAQRLVKVLCSSCKIISHITEEEIAMLKNYTIDIPEKVARPVGCLKCDHTGYLGREGIFEVINFNSEISRMIRNASPISEIRNFIRNQGDCIMSDHAISKIKEFKCDVKQIFNKILSDEEDLIFKNNTTTQPSEIIIKNKVKPNKQERKNDLPSILLLEDDIDEQKLIELYLRKDYNIDFARDGIEGFIKLGGNNFDLILVDVIMPNMDGFAFIKELRKKNINIPIIFLTAVTDNESEIKGLKLGAIDYIRKPLKKEVLLLRIKHVIDKE